MNRNKDLVQEILKCCEKREEILRKDQPISRYNHYFDKMRKLARQLINENRQDELLPYIDSESINIRAEIALILFHFYPEKCTQILQEISDMTIPTGLPRHLVLVAASAHNALKYGIPKEYP